MKNIAVLLCAVVLAGCFASCGMKECKCFSSNVVYKDGTALVVDTLESGVIGSTYVDIIDTLENSTDLVNNFTREDCEIFNKNEVLDIDSIRHVHHTVICEEQ